MSPLFHKISLNKIEDFINSSSHSISSFVSQKSEWAIDENVFKVFIAKLHTNREMSQQTCSIFFLLKRRRKETRI